MTLERRQQIHKDKLEMYENTDPKRVFVNKGELIWNRFGQFWVAIGDGREKRLTGIFRSQTRVYWVFDGEKHRSDGPAVCNLQNPNEDEFWLNGVRMTEKEFKDHYLVIHLREYPRNTRR